MSKAEELSQNRYPTMAEKYAFIDGYEQAEKDLELTVDDIMKIDALLIEMWNRPSNEDKYQEVLKRFKQKRDKKFGNKNSDKLKK